MEDENSKKWNCIYLPYLDSRKKISEGRKVALKYCVPDVRTSEISTALKQLKFEHKVEKKSYCRDFLSVGRIRVELKRDGDLIDETIKNRYLNNLKDDNC
ncbi:hypothetical protein MHBO_000104 [Bonamia ostreae]|uniref:Signal recognition particle 19 kDa protein n=1 Tax=Bonamia ostreae TaxID=126728 RepID=A0ABV2AFD7_9EUKA